MVEDIMMIENTAYERIKDYLYKPQPLNYTRVNSNERLMYEWLLQQKIYGRVFYPPHMRMVGYIRYQLWQE